MKFICELCKNIVSDISDPIFRCPVCGSPKSAYKIYYEIEEIDKKVFISNKNAGINRIDEKCINCGMCRKTCNKVTSLNFDKNNPECVNCGNCILTCPTGSLTPRYNYNEVKNILNEEKVVVAFIAPAVRTSISESFNLETGINLEGKVVNALKLLGFNYVLDTTFGADITIMEESKELLERLNSKKNLPLFTSCCPAWVKFIETKYPKFIPNLSSTKSPNSIMGSLIKSYFAESKNIKPENIITVGIVPCTAKKCEGNRKELVNNNLKNVDYYLTTTELIMLIKENNIDFLSLEDKNYDSLMGTGSSAGLIFGSTGGVMEANLRTLEYRLTGKNEKLDVKNIRTTDSIKKATIKIANKEIKVAVVYGLNNAKTVIEEIENNDIHYDFIEVMACPCGCIGGAGNPLQNVNKFQEIRENRLKELFNVDNSSVIKNPYQNKEVQKLYNKFLNKEKIHTLLHTTYSDKSQEVES